MSDIPWFTILNPSLNSTCIDGASFVWDLNSSLMIAGNISVPCLKNAFRNALVETNVEGRSKIKLMTERDGFCINLRISVPSEIIGNNVIQTEKNIFKALSIGLSKEGFFSTPFPLVMGCLPDEEDGSSYNKFEKAKQLVLKIDEERIELSKSAAHGLTKPKRRL